MKSKTKFKSMALALLGLGLFVSAMYATTARETDKRMVRADVIVIDAMKIFGNLERPGVPFPHDQHTRALAEQGGECSTCHESRDGRLISKFRRAADTDRASVLDIYHDNCIGCHEQTAAADMTSGPLECGSCHQLSPEFAAGQQMINFDPSLHQRHIDANDNKCDSCHHGYNPTEKQIVYTKGEEESCRTCHEVQLLDQAKAYREAAHQQCISCHLEEKTVAAVENEMVAEVKCAGCHDEAQLSGIARLDRIPRLDRNQPDITLVKSIDQGTIQLMDFVLFDHQRHEQNLGTCSTCHHNSLQSCENCHSLAGSSEGDWVTLAQAMHETRSDRSCIGCHAREVREQDCAGCHTLLKTKMHVSEGRSCTSCHSVPAAYLLREKAQNGKVAAAGYHSEPAAETTVDLEALPEKVTIDVISDEYRGVSFPHRQIVRSMLDRIEGNALAARFHSGKDTVCQSCHHNSPEVTDPPPRCISCHGPLETARNGGVPEMQAAYHQQCFDCHKAMDISTPAATNCVSCHAEKTETAMIGK